MPSYLQRRSFVAACFLAALVCSSARADNFDALYVFGDSLSDAGNLAILDHGTEPAAPYSNGRFSNGPIWAQDMATKLGLPAVTASYAGGTDYAVGGAQTTPANSPLPIDLPSQLNQFASQHPVVDPNGLYMIWIGSNDLRAILASSPSSTVAQNEALQVVANIDSAIMTLSGDGAKNFLVVTVPDLGMSPAAIATGPAGEAAASGLSYLFDQALLQSVKGGNPALSGLHISTLDTFPLIDSIVAQPGQYGFTNVAQPCLTGETNYAGGTPCSNPNQYLFWDQLHPTAAGQAIVADAALQAVPEPATLTMISGAAGVLALVIVRRRRGSDLLN